MVLVIGRIILPYIPIALGIMVHSDFQGRKVPQFMSEFLTDVSKIVLLPKNQ